MNQKLDKGFKKISSLLAKEFFKGILPFTLFFLLSFLILFRFFNPTPPNQIKILISESYTKNKAYASIDSALLKQHGITLNIQETSSDLESLKIIKSNNADIDLAFIQDGVARHEGAGRLESLGSLYYEPIWILCRCKSDLSNLAKLKGKRIAVGEVASGSYMITMNLLKESGVDSGNTTLIKIAGDTAVQALNDGKVDVAIIVDESDSFLVKRALENPKIKLVSLDEAEALSRQNSYLHHLILPESSIDIAKNLPSKTVHLVATTMMIVKSENMHPALEYLMIKVMKKVHSGSGLLHSKDTFPSIQGSDFPLSKQAENFYRFGPPFVDKYLPFWASTFVSITLIVVLPLLVILLPISKGVTFAYNTLVRWRLFSFYGELRYLELQLINKDNELERDYFCRKLDEIEKKVNAIKLPIRYSQYHYELMSNIDFVRSKI
jgi:TRAP-type uncharacterized transport system substrate-binding protein